MEYESLFAGLIIKCPLDDEIKDCCFAPLRNKSAQEIFKMFRDIPNEKKIELINEHKKCLARWEKKTIAV